MSTQALISADFKTIPYDHQFKEFEYSADLPSRALFWQMRTGKTKLIIDTACNLHSQGKIDCVLIFAPNGVHDNWVRRELNIHHWDSIEYQCLVWNTDIASEKGVVKVKAADKAKWKQDHLRWWQTAKELIKSSNLTWFSFASETMVRDDVRKLIKRIIRNKHGKILVVFDESHDFRKPSAKRTSMARAIANKCSYRRILTGTPLDNSPLHAWGQFELLKKGALGFEKYSEFEANHAIYVLKRAKKHQYKQLSEYINLDSLRSKMAKYSSVVLREDCTDLPSIVPETIEVGMTYEQVQVYSDLRTKYELEIGENEISVGENTNRLIKLQQVASGFIKDEFGETYRIPGANPKLEALIEEVERASGKCIIWAAFHEDMDLIAKTLRDRGHEIVEYHGRISTANKLKARKAFEPGAENNIKALVGYSTSGLDLSAASKIIWYSHVFDGIKRSQADERATAIGGGNIPVIDFIGAPIDKYIRDSVKNNIDIASSLTREGMKKILQEVKL
jgi:hypothetical protein